jgi:hypothetical protein
MRRLIAVLAGVTGAWSPSLARKLPALLLLCIPLAGCAEGWPDGTEIAVIIAGALLLLLVAIVALLRWADMI